MAVYTAIYLTAFPRFSYDLTFDAYGYFLIFINDICTAANGVYVKKKLDAKVGQVWLVS